MIEPLEHDLAREHASVSALFEQPQSPEAWERYRLSDDQLAFFAENGYLPNVRILSDAQVEVFREQLDRLMGEEHANSPLFYEYHRNESVDKDQVLFHALGAWRIESAFHDLLWAPAFRMAAYQLLGGPVRQFHDQLFCKPAGHGGVVAWHQDYSYWTWTRPMQHLTCWIGLDDVSEENGCLCYVPGSHRWGLLPVTGLTGDMDAVREVLNDEQCADFAQRTPVCMPKGCATFHHPLTMHGSYANRSDRPRRATVLNVVKDGVQSNADELPDDWEGNFPILPQGETLDGPFYPLLFDPAAELA